VETPRESVWGFFMETISDPQAMHRRTRQWRDLGLKVVLVPTMGFFHQGHLSLMEYGRSIGDRLVVSLFVNPTQFGPQEDLQRYPRDLDRDLRLAREAGVDCLYTPEAGAMYPPGYQTYVTVEALSGVLCGASRPGHFKGVATVVLKLLHQVEPQVAVFGEKDYQQLVVVKRMVADLEVPTEIVGRPIVRESDGLAMSSRNTYLNPEERAAALCLYRGIQAARERVAAGEKSRERIVNEVREIITRTPYSRIDYVELVDPETLQAVEAIRGEARLVLAGWINNTRLIDNTLLTETRLCSV
jgi:pantoate--beta-alanine ligase